MQDNKSRGDRALFWMIVNIVITFVVGAVAIYFLQAISQVQSDNGSAGFGAGLGLLALCGLGIFWSIAAIFEGIFWYLWIFRITKNLRKVSNIAFGPWVALLLSCVPYFGHIVHYFVFKSLIRHTEKVLHEKDPEGSLKLAPVEMKFVHAYFALMLMSGFTGMADGLSRIVLVGFACGIAAMVFYMKSFSQLIKEEQALFDLYQEEQLRLKVDQVLREREIEKAAAEIREASYETTYKTENPPEDPTEKKSSGD